MNKWISRPGNQGCLAKSQSENLTATRFHEKDQSGSVAVLDAHICQEKQGGPELNIPLGGWCIFLWLDASSVR